MGDGTQDLGIESGIPGELFGVDLVAFADIANNRMQFRDVGDEYFVTIRLPLLRDPNRMRSRLESNPGVRHTWEVLFHRTGHGAEPSFFDHLGLFIQNAIVTPSVSEIDADRDLML